jgi:putative oxidoreductase
MNYIDSMAPYRMSERNNWIHYLRILLGGFIVYKGLLFTRGTDVLYNSITILLGTLNPLSTGSEIVNISMFSELSMILNNIIIIFLLTYIILTHLIGGLLLIIGLYTRWVCLAQIPILLGAILFVNLPQYSLYPTTNLELGTTIIALFGLIFFFSMGASVNSLDELRRKEMQQLS